ncbi:MAG: SBBP repeat-containing protein, partial [Bacteroidales bacterium]|nr:SBBP repeat-containing protein [Bacteroidales bacterium]
YIFQSENQVGFSVGDYDPNRHLVIDPVLAYSTYRGGSGTEIGKAITVDTLGNVYVTGMAAWDFPVDDSMVQATNAGMFDVFVAKLNADGSDLLYATYIGGSEDGSGLGGDDLGLGIAVDPKGNAYITGSTQSDDFPLQNAMQTTFRGDDFYTDAFVVKLNPNGTALLYSTYLGGDESETGYDIVADRSGHAYVVGGTSSGNFPVKNAFDSTLNGGGDVFVSKIKPDGSNFVFSTYLGGGSGERGRGIAIDEQENIYLTGATGSADFPLVSAYQELNIGGDAFVTKMKADGSGLVFSTHLTGVGTDPNDLHIDEGTSIAVDSLGYVYVAGMTQSPDFPTVNAVQENIGGAPDGFVTKFTPDGSSLVYSTYLGGSHWEGGLDIEVDLGGNAYIAGSTQSSDFKTQDALQSTLSGLVDVFVTKIDAAGSAIVFSTFLGGSSTDGNADWDGKDGIAVDLNRNVYVTSRTSSADFPPKEALQETFGGGGDAFVAKIDIEEKLNWIEITSSYTLPEGIRIFEGTRSDPKLKAFYIDADLNRPELSVRPYIRGVDTKKNVKDFNHLVNAHASINGGFFYKSSAILSAVVYPTELKARNVDSLKREINDIVRWYPVIRGFFGMKEDRSLSVDWIYHITHLRNGIYTFTDPFSYTLNDIEPRKEPKPYFGTEYSNLVTGIGGGPVLIKNNSIRVTYNEEVLWGGSGVEYNKRDPRTAVGYTANKHVIMLVADGRSDQSEGIGLPELAQIMFDLGCVEALNLDGGGSSQLAVGNTFVNTPSDETPRKVPAILSIVNTNALNLHDTPA